MVWTQFMDMHSGGGSKDKWEYIYIEAPESEAKIIFFNRFEHNPERVTCTCCGDDYSINESETLEQATAFERKCRSGYVDKDGKEVPKDKAWKSGVGMINGAVKDIYFEEEDTKKVKEMNDKYPDSDWNSYYKYVPLKKYIKKKDILVIYTKDIKPKERKGEVPEQGYVWQE